jgi:DNA-damage-inducible protein J
MKKEVIIMAQTLINIRIDEDVKKSMEETCKELGITISAAFNIFARKMSREKRIPFEVSVDPFYSESNMKAIAESVKQIEEGKVVVKTMEELEEMENE